MASSILRNANLRSIHRNLLPYIQLNSKITKPSSPYLQRFHGAPEILQSRPISASQPFIRLGYGIQCPKIAHRYLCSGATTSAANLEKVAKPIESDSEKAAKPIESDSGKGEQSEESHQTGDAGKPVRGGPVSWLSFLLLISTGAGLIFYYDNEKKRHIEEINNASTAVKQGPSVGKAAIGGPFNLVNHDGKFVSDKDFLGKWNLIYFGFTHCPDICPDELQKLSTAVDKIKEKAGIEVVPVFISVDPERDTVKQVCEYVKEFHPNLIGLTGNVDEIRKVARAYRVYYMKTEEEGSDYLVDHSIVMYLMGPDMDFVKFFGKNYDIDALVEGVIKEIKQYKK
ncbi:hypothetical protein HHK36_016173 [Tetracentron sinense]|uniref:Thioredoxin domain-containing protein n=1 Tax=Tetracentron sinense TaxID=13715 RepID=A0A835DAS3_TETSI|nr:hypothetical protein HHK36_016173 [Tetracentron sinense]